MYEVSGRKQGQVTKLFGIPETRLPRRVLREKRRYSQSSHWAEGPLTERRLLLWYYLHTAYNLKGLGMRFILWISCQLSGFHYCWFVTFGEDLSQCHPTPSESVLRELFHRTNRLSCSPELWAHSHRLGLWGDAEHVPLALSSALAAKRRLPKSLPSHRMCSCANSTQTKPTDCWVLCS